MCLIHLYLSRLSQFDLPFNGFAKNILLGGKTKAVTEVMELLEPFHVETCH